MIWPFNSKAASEVSGSVKKSLVLARSQKSGIGTLILYYIIAEFCVYYLFYTLIKSIIYKVRGIFMESYGSMPLNNSS